MFHIFVGIRYFSISVTVNESILNGFTIGVVHLLECIKGVWSIPYTVASDVASRACRYATCFYTVVVGIIGKAGKNGKNDPLKTAENDPLKLCRPNSKKLSSGLGSKRRRFKPELNLIFIGLPG